MFIVCCPSKEGIFKERVSDDKPSLPISNSCQLHKGTFVLLNRT